MQVFIADIVIITNQSNKMDILSIYSKLTFNQNMKTKMIISVSVFKIYKEYLDFTLHYLAGII